MADRKLRDAISDAAAERVRFIMKNREALLEAWFAQTGVLPTEAELVERHHGDGSVTVTVTRRTEAPGRIDD